MNKTGYYYLLHEHIIGETHDPETEPYHNGHADFWEHECGQFFSASPEINELQLCWYGCERGRITFIDGKFKALGTPGTFKHYEQILTLFGFNENDPVIPITHDNHYRIVDEDAGLLKRNSGKFSLPEKYEYLIGRIKLNGI